MFELASETEVPLSEVHGTAWFYRVSDT